MIEILQVRSASYSSCSENFVNVSERPAYKAAFVVEQKGIDRIEIGENRLPERVLGLVGCGKAEDGSG
ncbi:MAG: hypothetical protein WBF04_10125 [Candidatus Sulfotelmatobacter sp.]